MPRYIDIPEADQLAAGLPNLALWIAQDSDDVKNAALEYATQRFDLAYRYQGRKYDSAQELEFPRLAYETRAAAAADIVIPGDARMIGNEIWDWDSVSRNVVVPLKVKRAVLFEANSIISADRERIAEAIHNGLASQSAGTLSETYARLPANAGGVPLLCREADAVARFYKLRTGAIR